MATNPASSTDLENRSLRPLSAHELTVGETLLDDAWAIILSRVPSVGDRLDGTPIDLVFESLVIQVECAMVLRVLSNPEGKLEEQVDDYRYRLDQARSTGSLYLSDAELALLSAGDGASDTAFTIKPAGLTPDSGTWLTPDTWVPAS